MTGDAVPLLMRNIYLENKNKIGKVDDVFGLMTKAGIAIKPDEGVKAESFKAGDKVHNLVVIWFLGICRS
jgi:H/ACA ribonucleoprotein complex subunit 1